MVLENIEEIALAVVNQEEAVALFEDLFGIEFKDAWTVPVDSMRVISAKIGDTQFHLLASEKPDALIANYIRNSGEGIHHIAFRVSNLKQLIVRLREKGIRFVPDEPREDELRRYIFVHPKSMYGLLLELIEYKRS
jgi:methylmalonyl-CoA/ethylmalonyl-CoA epimerase